MNQQVMMRRLMKMKQEMEDAQKEIENTEFKATASGIVTVTVLGTKQLVRVEFSDDFDYESKDDLEMVSDLIVAACNVAYQDIEKVSKEKLGKYESMLGGLM